MEAAREVTRGGGAADEEEGNVGGLPGVREGSFCACQSLTAHQDLCTASSLNLQRRQSACFSSHFYAFHFLSLPFFSLFFSSIHLVIIYVECTEVPGFSVCWNYLPLLAAGGGRQLNSFTVTGVDPENSLASPIYAVVQFPSHRH